jgi:hypothetical protein
VSRGVREPWRQAALTSDARRRSRPMHCYGAGRWTSLTSDALLRRPGDTRRSRASHCPCTGSALSVACCLHERCAAACTGTDIARLRRGAPCCTAACTSAAHPPSRARTPPVTTRSTTACERWSGGFGSPPRRVGTGMRAADHGRVATSRRLPTPILRRPRSARSLAAGSRTRAGAAAKPAPPRTGFPRASSARVRVPWRDTQEIPLPR